jgi:hypothetical protein
LPDAVEPLGIGGGLAHRGQRPVLLCLDWSCACRADPPRRRRNRAPIRRTLRRGRRPELDEFGLLQDQVAVDHQGKQLTEREREIHVALLGDRGAGLGITSARVTLVVTLPSTDACPLD